MTDFQGNLSPDLGELSPFLGKNLSGKGNLGYDLSQDCIGSVRLREKTLGNQFVSFDLVPVRH